VYPRSGLFAPVKVDPNAQPIPSRGNRGQLHLHRADSRSTRRAGQRTSRTGRTEPRASFDAEVAKIMRRSTYTSLFVDMKDANDEGGAAAIPLRDLHDPTFRVSGTPARGDP